MCTTQLVKPRLYWSSPVLAGLPDVASEGFELLTGLQPLETKYYPHLHWGQCLHTTHPSRRLEAHPEALPQAHRIAHGLIGGGIGEIRITFGNDLSPSYKGCNPSQGAYAKIICLQLPDNELTANERQSIHG